MRAVLLALLLVAGACAPVAGEAPSLPRAELRLGAASNMSFALQELIPTFEAREGARVKLTLGSSGNFYAQIANGAPFDVFLSADTIYPQRLAEVGLAEAPVPYAVGRLVLWVPRPTMSLAGIGYLSRPDVQRIAIANPELAPYGVAAVDALTYYGLHNEAKPKLVLGENVSQAAQFAHSGVADAALIPLSVALAPEMVTAGTAWEVPAEAHTPIRQAAVILKGASGPARAFLAVLTGREGKEILVRHGFEAP